MKLPIFMDYHSTTPVDPRVVEEMLPYFTEDFGNAASRNHSFGWKAEEAVERGRQRIGSIIHADPKEVIFTSGATESNNLALKGVAEMYAEKGDHLITCVTEHKAILDTCKHLEKKGKRVTYLPVDPSSFTKGAPEAANIQAFLNRLIFSLAGSSNAARDSGNRALAEILEEKRTNLENILKEFEKNPSQDRSLL